MIGIRLRLDYVCYWEKCNCHWFSLLVGQINRRKSVAVVVDHLPD